MRHRIVETGGSVKAGNGALIRGKYALYRGKEFISASDDPEKLLKLIPEDDIKPKDYVILGVLAVLLLTAEWLADLILWMVG